MPPCGGNGDVERWASTERQSLITPDTKLQRHPQAVARELAEGDAVLLHLDSGQYHGLNPVGLVIWELLEQPSTVADVIDRLRDRVEDPPPSLESDVLRYLTGLRERDLVTTAER